MTRLATAARCARGPQQGVPAGAPTASRGMKLGKSRPPRSRSDSRRSGAGANTHKNEWSATPACYLVSGDPGVAHARMTKIYDLSNPAAPVFIAITESSDAAGSTGPVRPNARPISLGPKANRVSSRTARAARASSRSSIGQLRRADRAERSEPAFPRSRAANCRPTGAAYRCRSRNVAADSRSRSRRRTPEPDPTTRRQDRGPRRRRTGFLALSSRRPTRNVSSRDRSSG